ncbi:MAG: hypothetical protein JXM71_01380 [Spirochaetales bacterium]|nr:hypothetical protein [Spirochaetales bacterium]
MEATHDDTREAILERMFPDLRYGGDPDIERYFDLRSSGRMGDALAIYRARLIPRYPDEGKRIALLRLYRTNSPVYPEFLRMLLMERADEMISVIRTNIDALARPLSGVPLHDTYAVLKAVERVAHLLPDNVEQSRKTATVYAEFARLLGYRTSEMEQVAFLLGEFYDQSSADRDVPRDFVMESLASEEEKQRRTREETRKNFFDLSKIEFDAEDVKRIEIPAGLQRDEDKVLAYCHKYWLRVDDPAFERILWLYSKKYSSQHFEIFRAIQTGRRKKYQDDDILSMVAQIIATSYTYTVQGDVYMQMTWRVIKASLYGQAAAQRAITRQSAQSALPAEPARKPAPKLVTRRAKNRRARARRSAAVAVASHSATTAKPTRAKPAPVPALRPTGSISDKIKRLSGRAYDVYHDIFLSSVRTHIRAVLQKHRAKPTGVFDDSINEAENIVYSFIEVNYANAYMRWQDSEHRTRVAALGFDLESLDDIIEFCYRKIS